MGPNIGNDRVREHAERRHRVDSILADVDARLSAEDQEEMRTVSLYDEAGLVR